jgi:hypothetical protein
MFTYLKALGCVCKWRTEDARVVDEQVQGQALGSEGVSKLLDRPGECDVGRITHGWDHT